jgi:hypothetical protein
MTIQTLASYLDRFGWKQYEIHSQERQKEGILEVSWFLGPLDNSFQLVIDPVVEHGLLIFRSQRLAAIPSLIHKKTKLEMLEMLAQQNSATPFGSYGINLKKEFVTYRLVVPIDAPELTYELFVRYLTIAKRSCEACGSSVFGTLDAAGPKWSDKDEFDREAKALLDYFNQRMLDEKEDQDPEGG